MCGSATHPGGGIMGAPGRNAALRMLKDIAALPRHLGGTRRLDSTRENDAQTHDIVIVGGGHNGLVDGLLSGEGRNEAARARAHARGGGRRGTEEIHPGLPLVRSSPTTAARSEPAIMRDTAVEWRGVAGAPSEPLGVTRSSPDGSIAVAS